MEIRKATPSDTGTIAALAEKIWMQYYPEIITVEQIRYMLDKMYSAPALQQQMSEGQDFYLLLENEQPIGYCSFSTTEPGHYFLHKFYVDTHYHGKGIGTFLLNEMLKQLAPVLTVRLTVNQKKLPFHQLLFQKWIHHRKNRRFRYRQQLFHERFHHAPEKPLVRYPTCEV
jgi:GNAT superfamily N-acetyltransferase